MHARTRIRIAVTAIVLTQATLAQAAGMAVHRAAKERDCWDLYASLRNVDRLDRAISRGATWQHVRERARRTEALLDRQRDTLRRMGTATDLLTPPRPVDWFDPRYRRRLAGSLRRTSRGLNCSQYMSEKPSLFAGRAGERPVVRAKSLRLLGLVGEYSTSLMLLTAAFLAAVALAIRDSLEKRRHVRFLVRLPATAVCRGEARGVMLRDVSRGGARIEYGETFHLARGDRLTLAFADMRVGGRIVWAADGLAGLAFDRKIRVPARIRRVARELR